MKKFFALTVILILVLAGCDELFNPDDVSKIDDGNNNGNSDKVIGTWTGTYSGSVVTLEIAQGTWVITIQGEDGSDTDSGTWYQTGNTYQFSSLSSMSGTGTLTGETLALRLSYGYDDAISIQFKRASSSPGEPSTGDTTLTIKNESSYEITNVIWNNVSFTQGSESIKSGKSVTKTVQAGEGYIRFTRKTDPINAQSKEWVVIEKGDKKERTINNNYPIVDADNTANEGTVGTLGVRNEPQITVQAGDAFIAQFGDYDFGGVLVNANKDVTFTIGNSGKADLRFNVVEGSVINLSNNASGHFIVSQQPFASMTIAPGSTTTFVISFSPKAAGNNLNAEVMIKTNSETNAEFTFRVKGNGNNEYQIGDTGPGGGTIFFAQGGQYKECSGELGAYNWADAMSTATNFKGGSFTNWRLPDKGELDIVYQKRTTIGGFSYTGYWSSTEAATSGYAYVQNFGTSSLTYYYNSTAYTISPGGQDWVSKYSTYRVRAVRSFSL